MTCTFTRAQAAAGVAIPYDVIVAAPVSDVVTEPQDGGQCQAPGPSGLITFERLAGSAQNYCLCDIGRCPELPLPARTLAPGTYASTFLWRGRNWFGPSDTSTPEGAPFPPGKYSLSVRAKGTVASAPFDVEATLAVTIVSGGTTACEAKSPENFCGEGDFVDPCPQTPGYHSDPSAACGGTDSCCTPDPFKCCKKGSPDVAPTCDPTCSCPAGYGQAPIGAICN